MRDNLVFLSKKQFWGKIEVLRSMLCHDEALAKFGYVTTHNKIKIEIMKQKYIRKVTRVGKRSLSIVIPSEIVQELKIREKQKLIIRKSGQKIVIEDWK